ncbi:cupin domain-containing protein [Loktanella sp. DJP18]|uniref:cupin domain-containing protein n=1 Tax=Loktanella sp. DJP18 TaxID=3409788 RepID=UPI003BB57BA5
MDDKMMAEVCLPTTDLTGDLGFFSGVLGMRMLSIFPADDPAVAVFGGHGLRVRLERGQGAPGRLRILTDMPFADGADRLVSPGGTVVDVAGLTQIVQRPPTQHRFVVRRLADQAPWVIGRAGMQYRDLIPDRLGGSIIASHIRIPDGGPVPDTVHFHRVGFQLIFCYRGWVDVVYEDQGGLIRLSAGDCVIQPPEIRHRVLEASDGIEVIEIGVPAEHLTEIDHDLTLPTPDLRPDRRWQGQRFVHSRAQDAVWRASGWSGLVARDTGISDGTQGVAGVRVLRRGGGPTAPMRHDADIHFTFVMDGTCRLQAEGQDARDLSAGDAFVSPPGMAVCLAAPSDDLELLEVTLPGKVALTT